MGTRRFCHATGKRTHCVDGKFPKRCNTCCGCYTVGIQLTGDAFTTTFYLQGDLASGWGDGAGHSISLVAGVWTLTNTVQGDTWTATGPTEHNCPPLIVSPWTQTAGTSVL